MRDSGLFGTFCTIAPLIALLILGYYYWEVLEENKQLKREKRISEWVEWLKSQSGIICRNEEELVPVHALI